MSVRQILTSLVLSALLCGATSLALAQSAAPKGAKEASKPAATEKPAAAAKSAARPEATAAAGSAEPTLLGQFGTWGAYTATPNEGREWQFALKLLF